MNTVNKAGLAVLGCALVSLATSLGLSATVTVCAEAQLRESLISGGTLRFECDGTITLSSPLVITGAVVLDGTGRNVALSGAGAARLFEIASNASLTLSNLALVNGRSTNGGAIFNQGTLTAVGCVFTNNRALGLAGSAGEGGAVWNGGVAVLRDCSFQQNSAMGGESVFVANAPQGNGGAVCNRGSLLLSNCAMSANTASGGAGVPGIFFPPGAGTGGPGQGGAFYNAQSAVVLNSTFSANTSTGGPGGAGGLSTAGGNGGAGFGGAWFNAGTLAATNCTMHGNRATGGPGVYGRLGWGIDGQGFGGGGVQAAGTAAFVFSTFAANSSTHGGGALHGLGNAVVRLGHSILAHVPGNSNGSGAVEDLGYNLSSDFSVSFTNTGSIHGIAPKLGPPANNGGPTPTLALLAGSPAIDAGAFSTTVATDQRGFPRPAGVRSDIGAFEGSAGPLVVTLVITPSATLVKDLPSWLEITVANTNNFSCTGLRLTNWLSTSLSVAAGSTDTAGFNGTLTAMPGTQVMVLSGFSLPPAETCVVRLPISADAVGIGTATVSGIQSDQLGGQTLALTAFLNVSGPPDGHTDAATGVDFTSATLRGTINPGGAATTWWFEYGTSDNFGETTPPQSLPAGLTDGPVAAAVNGLPSTMDFVFRVAASNEFGTFHGHTRTFFTLGDVAVCDEAHLRANLVRGGTVRIVCDGVIVLSNTLLISINTEIDATGYQTALSGNDAVRVVEVAAGASLTLRGLTITRGRSTSGAGIHNAGTLLLDRCVLTANHAVGLTGAQGQDGASAPPHPPAPPQDGQAGGSGGEGGSALGGGLYNVGECIALWTTLSSNSATGGIGGKGGRAGGPNYSPGNFVPGGLGGLGGRSGGGGIFNLGELTLSNCCVFANRTTGGRGGLGGANFPAFANAPGGPGGAGVGAGVRNANRLTLINVTLANNEAVGGSVGEGFVVYSSGGAGAGGGLSTEGAAGLTNCTFAWNQAVGGTPNGLALGASLATTGAVAVLKNVLLAHPPSGTNAFGPVVDAGHNLSSDNSCNFTEATSLSNVDPGLGALTDAGGPTLSIPLLDSSPAIDAGDNSNCPPTDQRGFPRPALGDCDIGAYERQPDHFALRSIRPLEPQAFGVRGIGLPGANYRLLASDDLVRWFPSVSGTVGANGLFEITAPAGGTNHCFFRIVSP